jgi:hypothetical protein
VVPDETVRYTNDILNNNTYRLISRWILMGAEAPQGIGEDDVPYCSRCFVAC